VYEAADGFAALPSFFTIPAHPAILAVPLDRHLPGCDVTRGLHAEQYIELPAPAPPTGADVVTSVQVPRRCWRGRARADSPRRCG
jgi:hypothetical protein